MSNQTTFRQKMKTYLHHPGSFLMMLLVLLGAVVTFTVLIFLIIYILVHGVPYIKPSLFSFTYTSDNASLMPALVNTVTMTLLSLVVAVPLGIFAAIFLVEYAKRGNRFMGIIRLTTETLSGIPSIVYGLFGMLFFVNTLDWGFSLLAGAFTLAIMILPLIMRTTEEALKAVPDTFREGGREAQDRVPYRASVRRTGHPCRCDSCNRQNRRRDSGADVYGRNRGKYTIQRDGLRKDSGRAYV